MIQVAMLDAMISYLWPEGMMQYTVIGSEATSAIPMIGQISWFKDQRRLHHGRHHFRFRMAGLLQGIRRSGTCQRSALCDAVGAFGQRHRAHQTRWPNISPSRTTAEWLERLDAADVPCAPILRRGEIIHNGRWWPAVSSPSSISLRWGGCGSRSPRRGSCSTRLSSADPAPRRRTFPRCAARSRLRRRRHRQDGQRKVGPVAVYPARSLLHRNDRASGTFAPWRG